MAKKLTVEKDIVLWKDRRRRMGIPLSFTRYKVCEDKLILSVGFFKTTIDEILLYRIMDIKLVRTLWQKICRVGSVYLVSTDKSHPNLELKNIKHSDTVRRFLSEMIVKQRTARGISGRELLGDISDDQMKI